MDSGTDQSPDIAWKFRIDCSMAAVGRLLPAELVLAVSRPPGMERDEF